MNEVVPPLDLARSGSLWRSALWLASSAKRQLGGVHGRGRALPCALDVVHQERAVLADHDQVELYRVDVWVEHHVRDTAVVYELADHAHRARRWILAPTKGVDRSGADGIRAGHCEHLRPQPLSYRACRVVRWATHRIITGKDLPGHCLDVGHAESGSSLQRDEAEGQP